MHTIARILTGFSIALREMAASYAHELDGVESVLYGLDVPSLSTIPYADLKVFSQKKRRRNRRVQLEGRYYTQDIHKAYGWEPNVFIVLVDVFLNNRRHAITNGILRETVRVRRSFQAA